MSENVKNITMAELQFVKQIGRGSFSTVYEMLWKTNNNAQVAAKKLVTPESGELEIISKLEHPNIAKLLGVVDEGITFLLIIEYCEGGSLRSYLNKGEPKTRRQFYDWAKQAAIPLGYLKEQQVVHKDVKSPNYLITKENNLKLTDFGLAKYVEGTMSNATGTASYPWMAPELLEDQLLSPTFDIYSYGVVVWELWTGNYPYEGLGCATIIMQVCKSNERLPIPLDCPQALTDLMRACWNKDWTKRPSIEDILLVLEMAEVSEEEAEAAKEKAEAAKKEAEAAKEKAEAEAAKEEAEEDESGDTSDTVTLPMAETIDEAALRLFASGPWQFVTQFGRMTYPVRHIAKNPNGDIAVVDHTRSFTIYSDAGVKKFRIMHEPNRRQITLPRQVIASSDGLFYFVTNVTEFIQVYSYKAEFIRQWESRYPNSFLLPAPYLWGITMDSTGMLLLGDINSMYINKHAQDSTYVASIKIGIQPRYLATTPHDTIVVADWYEPPQIVNSSGEVLHTFAHPKDEPQWNPQGLWCYDDIILIAETDQELEQSETSCYSLSGKYLGSLPITNASSVCVSHTDDGAMLIVGSERHGCRMFLLPKHIFKK